MKQHIKTHRIQQLDDMKEEVLSEGEAPSALHATLKSLPAHFLGEQSLNLTQ